MSNSLHPHKIFWPCLALLIALALFLWPQIVNELIGGSSDNAFHYTHAKLTFRRADGTLIPFNVEVARTPQEQSHGLMFLHSLAADAGMIFLRDSDEVATFWMENTLIPLDMLFVRHDGTIAKIVTNAKPLDLTGIGSDVPVRAVIEINGGEAERRGLREGDKVIYPGLGE